MYVSVTILCLCKRTVIMSLGKPGSNRSWWRHKTLCLELTDPGILLHLCWYFLMLYLARQRKSDVSEVSRKVAQPLSDALERDSGFAASFLFKNAIGLTLTEKVIILQFHWAIKKKVHWNCRRWNTVLSGLAGSLSTFRAEKHKFISEEGRFRNFTEWEVRAWI